MAEFSFNTQNNSDNGADANSPESAATAFVQSAPAEPQSQDSLSPDASQAAADFVNSSSNIPSYGINAQGKPDYGLLKQQMAGKGSAYGRSVARDFVNTHITDPQARKQAMAIVDKDFTAPDESYLRTYIADPIQSGIAGVGNYGAQTTAALPQVGTTLGSGIGEGAQWLLNSRGASTADADLSAQNFSRDAQNMGLGEQAKTALSNAFGNKLSNAAYTAANMAVPLTAGFITKSPAVTAALMGIQSYGASRLGRYQKYASLSDNQIKDLPEAQPYLQAGKTPEQARDALETGTGAQNLADVGSGALGALGASSAINAPILGKLAPALADKMAANGFTRIGAKAAEGAATNAALAVPQTALSNTAAGNQWKDNMSGAVINGALSGGLLAGGHELLAGKNTKAASAAQEQANAADNAETGQAANANAPLAGADAPQSPTENASANAAPADDARPANISPDEQKIYDAIDNGDISPEEGKAILSDFRSSHAPQPEQAQDLSPDDEMNAAFDEANEPEAEPETEQDTGETGQTQAENGGDEDLDAASREIDAQVAEGSMPQELGDALKSDIEARKQENASDGQTDADTAEEAQQEESAQPQPQSPLPPELEGDRQWLNGVMDGSEQFKPSAEAVTKALPASDNILGAAKLGGNTADMGRPMTENGKPFYPNQPVDMAKMAISPADFQFKASDKTGQTGALNGSEKWNPAYARGAMIFEDKNGKRWIADGHQRSGLARRLVAEGKETEAPTLADIYREKDGWTKPELKAIAAKRNMAQGTGSTMDAVKVIKQDPRSFENDPFMPKRGTNLGKAFRWAKLDDDILKSYEAGRLNEAELDGISKFPDKQRQIYDQFMAAHARGNSPKTLGEGEARAAEYAKEPVNESTQQSLFGDVKKYGMTMPEARGDVKFAAKGALRKNKALAHTLRMNADSAESIEGNKINREATAEQEERAKQTETIFSRILDNPAVEEKVNEVARKFAEGYQKKAFSKEKAGHEIANYILGLAKKNGIESLLKGDIKPAEKPKTGDIVNGKAKTDTAAKKSPERQAREAGNAREARAPRGAGSASSGKSAESDEPAGVSGSENSDSQGKHGKTGYSERDSAGKSEIAAADSRNGGLSESKRLSDSRAEANAADGDAERTNAAEPAKHTGAAESDEAGSGHTERAGSSSGHGESAEGQSIDEALAARGKDRIARSENALQKTKDKFGRYIDETWEEAHARQGEPSHTNSKGLANMRRAEKREAAMENLHEKEKAQEEHLDRLTRKIDRANETAQAMPEPIKRRIVSGELKQWQRNPNTFFVPGVDKGRILWNMKDGKLYHRYADQVRDPAQRAKFVKAFNDLKAEIDKLPPTLERRMADLKPRQRVAVYEEAGLRPYDKPIELHDDERAPIEAALDKLFPNKESAPNAEENVALAKNDSLKSKWKSLSGADRESAAKIALDKSAADVDLDKLSPEDRKALEKTADNIIEENKKQQPLFRRGGTEDKPVPRDEMLSATHTISRDKLEKAIDNGGMPYPSLAVSKESPALAQYGDVTFVADKNLIDPERGGEVFSRDSYSATYPEVDENNRFYDGEYNVPATIENITRYLKKNAAGGIKMDIRNSHDVAGELAQRLESLKDIQARRSDIAPHDIMEAADKRVSEEIEREVKAISAHWAKGELAAGETLDIASVIAKHGFRRAEKEIEEEISPPDREHLQRIIDLVKSLPTEYFEAKPNKDFVPLSDFKGAVVPDDLPADMRAKLEGEGLKLATYPAGDSSARARALRSLNNELHEENGNILFRRGDTPQDKPKTLTAENAKQVIDPKFHKMMDKGFLKVGKRPDSVPADSKGSYNRNGTLTLFEGQDPSDINETIRHEVFHAAAWRVIPKQVMEGLLMRANRLRRGVDTYSDPAKREWLDKTRAFINEKYKNASDTIKDEELLAEMAAGNQIDKEFLGLQADKIAGLIKKFALDKMHTQLGELHPDEIGAFINDMVRDIEENGISARDTIGRDWLSTPSHDNIITAQSLKNDEQPYITQGKLAMRHLDSFFKRMLTKIMGEKYEPRDFPTDYMGMLREGAGEEAPLKADAPKDGIIRRKIRGLKRGFAQQTLPARELFKKTPRFMQDFALSRNARNSAQEAANKQQGIFWHDVNKQADALNMKGVTGISAKLLSRHIDQILAAKGALAQNVRIERNRQRRMDSLNFINQKVKDPKLIKSTEAQIADLQQEIDNFRRFRNVRRGTIEELEATSNLSNVDKNTLEEVRKVRFANGMTDGEAKAILASRMRDKDFKEASAFADRVLARYSKVLDYAHEKGYLGDAEYRDFKDNPDYIRFYEKELSSDIDDIPADKLEQAMARMKERDIYGRVYGDGVESPINVMQQWEKELAGRAAQHSWNKQLLAKAVKGENGLEIGAQNAAHGYNVRVAGGADKQRLINALKAQGWQDKDIVPLLGTPAAIDKGAVVSVLSPAKPEAMDSLAERLFWKGSSKPAKAIMGTAKFVGKYATRPLSYMTTTASAPFHPINAKRDVSERLNNIFDQKLLPGMENMNDAQAIAQAELLKAKGAMNLPQAFAAAVEARALERGAEGAEPWEGGFGINRGIAKGVHALRDNKEYAQLYDDLKGRGAFMTRQQANDRDLNATFAKLSTWTSLPKRYAHQMANALRENAVTYDEAGQLAVAKALHDAGYHIDDIARALVNSMDFNERGTASPLFAPLFPFFNARIAGAGNVLRSLSTKRGWEHFAVMTVMGLAAHAALRALSPSDPDAGNFYDQLAQQAIDGNVMIPLGGNRGFLKIPLTYGLGRLAWAKAGALYRAYTGAQTYGDAAEQIFGAWADELAPAAQARPADWRDHPFYNAFGMITPEFLHRIVNVGLNIGDMGAPIHGDLKDDVSASQQGKRGTASFYNNVAKIIARGSDGLIDLAPEDYAELLKAVVPAIPSPKAGVGKIAAGFLGWNRLHKSLYTVDNPTQQDEDNHATADNPLATGILNDVADLKRELRGYTAKSGKIYTEKQTGIRDRTQNFLRWAKDAGVPEKIQKREVARFEVQRLERKYGNQDWIRRWYLNAIK